MSIIFVLLFVLPVVCFEPAANCLKGAKTQLCEKFVHDDLTYCLENTVPYYNKISLDICITNDPHEHRCVELRKLCMHYRYVAVYLPDYPEDEEYTLTCTTLYYAAAPVAGGAFLLFTITLLIACHLCRKAQQDRQEEQYRVKYSARSFLLSVDERLATVNPSASIVRVQPFGLDRPERPKKARYGATTSRDLPPPPDHIEMVEATGFSNQNYQNVDLQ